MVLAGSLAKAAQVLCCSASALSQQMAALEREVGCPVLQRHARGVRPTEAGAALVARAAQLRLVLQTAEGEVDEIRHGSRGVVRISSFTSATVALLAPAARSLRASHPHVELRFRDLEPAQSLALVATRELDVALVFNYPALPGTSVGDVVMEPLLDDPLVLVVPAGHRLKSHAEPSVADLGEEVFVHGQDWGPPTRLLHTLAATAGFIPRTTCETDSYQVQVALVAAGLGIALVPRIALTSVPTGAVVVPLADPAARRTISLARSPRPGGAVDRVVQALHTAAAAHQSDKVSDSERGADH